MLVLVIAIIPFYIGYFIVSNLRYGRILNSLVNTYLKNEWTSICYLPARKGFVKLLTLLVWLFYLFFFWKVGDPFPVISSKRSLRLLSMEQGISRIGIIGVTVTFDIKLSILWTNRNYIIGYGSFVWLWCCKLSIHIHGCFYEVFHHRDLVLKHGMKLVFERPVTPADIQSVERRLMQTMDMIVVKKKRIALIERDAGRGKNRHVRENSGSSVWSMIKSVAMVGNSSTESTLKS